jgi:hypothetical protein
MSVITDVQRKVQEFASENASTLLTGGAVVGTVATAVLAGRAGVKAAEILREKNDEKKAEVQENEQAGIVDVPKDMLTKTEKLMLAGPQFIPPIIAGSATITAIIFSNRMSAQKAAALAAAYGLSQKQFEEYKAKVAEKLTGPKQQQIQDELAQERANRTPGSGQIVIVEGGDVLCFDQPTGRYFKSTMEKINRAVNRTNEEIINGEYASANFFYEELGLPPTTWADEVGFNTDNLVALDISTILSPEDEATPCLAIDFKRMPSADYIRRVFE